MKLSLCSGRFASYWSSNFNQTGPLGLVALEPSQRHWPDGVNRRRFNHIFVLSVLNGFFFWGRLMVEQRLGLRGHRTSWNWTRLPGCSGCSWNELIFFSSTDLPTKIGTKWVRSAFSSFQAASCSWTQWHQFLGNAGNRTRCSWVWSTNATSVLCGPAWVNLRIS